MTRPVQGDAARQAVESLGGYSYQIYSAAIAWATLRPGETLHLEIAEDFAISTAAALSAVQVKRTSTRLTSNSSPVTDLLDAFVRLRETNAERVVQVRLLTTATAALERNEADRLGNRPFVDEWALLRRGGDLNELRRRLAAMRLTEDTKHFLASLDDQQLREQVLSRIWFDCGSKPQQEIQAQLDDILVEIGMPLGFYAADSERSRPAIIEAILNVSAQAGLRELTPAGFRRTFESANTRTVSGSFLVGLGASQAMLTGDGGVLRDVGVSHGFGDAAPRTGILQECRGPLEQGMLWLHAGTGYGKTHIAKVLAEEFSSDAAILLLAGRDRAGTSAALKAASAELLLRWRATVIIDDLDYWESREVADAMQALASRAESRGHSIIVTAYKRPSEGSLTRMGLPSSCCREVTSLSEHDILTMARSAPTARKAWAKYILLSSGGGHPQLAHAMVQGLKARGWPTDELAALSGMLGEDASVNATRDDIRRRLVGELPEDARSLLYRLSLVVSRFDRELVDVVAEVPLQIATPGETLDLLVGPWIDRVGRDEFRLSPLLGNVGAKQLTAKEQKKLHHAIASSLVEGGSIDASRLDQLLLSGIVGEAGHALVHMAIATLRTSAEQIRLLARGASSLALLRTDRPIFPADRRVSVQLRMAQAVVRLASDDPSEFRKVFETFKTELSDLDDPIGRETLMMATGAKLLQMPELVPVYPEFPSLIAETVMRARSLGVDVDSGLSEEGRELGLPGVGSGLPMGHSMFAMRMSDVPSLDVLERVLTDLAGLSTEERAAVVPPQDGVVFNPEQIVKSIWLRAKKQDSYSSEFFTEACLDLATKLEGLEERSFAIACTSTAAVVLSEELSSHDRALDVLNKAEARLGVDYLIGRGRAGIYFTLHEYRRQLHEVAKLPFTFQENGWIEAAYLHREVAIAYAELKEWTQAAENFRIAKAHAANAHAPAMRLMAIGLWADEAVALRNGGNPLEALVTINEALSELTGVDPAKGFKERALHRLVRFVGFWMYAEEKKLKERMPEIQAEMVIGCCSNPNPHPELDEVPLGSVTMIKYLLAELDTAYDCQAGIWDEISKLADDDALIAQEASLAMGAFSAAADRRSPRIMVEFGAMSIDAMAATSSGLLQAAPDVLTRPGRLRPASEDDWERFRHEVMRVVTEFMIACIFSGETGKIDEFLVLDRRASRPLLRDAEIESLREAIVDAVDPGCSMFGSIGCLRRSSEGGQRPIVRLLFMTTLRLLDVARHHRRPPAWIDRFATWTFDRWREAIVEERFRFSTPLLAEQALLPMLARGQRNLAGVAELVLTVDPYIDVSLNPGHRAAIREIAGAGPHGA